jgi:hypothetical protein
VHEDEGREWKKNEKMKVPIQASEQVSYQVH